MGFRLKAFCAGTVLLGLCAGAFAAPGLAQPSDPPLTPLALRAALKTKSDAVQLAGQIRQTFRALGSGPQTSGVEARDLTGGANPKTEEINVAWAIDAPNAKNAPRIVADDNSYDFPLTPVGTSGLYARTVTLPDTTAFTFHYVVDGMQKGGGRVEVYQMPPELKANPNVPKGVLTQMPPWKSQVFADTTRNWWVYVPSQYDKSKPPAVMVFQDGGGPKNYIPTVFDNMIAKGEMPPTVAIFLEPGGKEKPRDNRSFEYDTLSPDYANFLLTEILPEVEKTTNLSHDPNLRAICGSSSGGICAWTVAWEKPDEFRNVVTVVGSFVNLKGGTTGIGGGHNYPTLIRKTKNNPKPIRLFQLDGKNDIDNQFGNWPLANKQVDKALTFAGYDHVFVEGSGFHGDGFLKARIGDALRWTWKNAVSQTPPQVSR